MTDEDKDYGEGFLSETLHDVPPAVWTIQYHNWCGQPPINGIRVYDNPKDRNRVAAYVLDKQDEQDRELFRYKLTP